MIYESKFRKEYDIMKPFYMIPKIEILSLNEENDVIRTSGGSLTLKEIGDEDGDDWDNE